MEILKLGDSLKTIVSKLNLNFGKCTRQQIIFNGSEAIPSNASGEYITITTTADLTQFDGLIFQRADCNAATFYIPPTVGQIYKIVSTQADFTAYMAGLNMFECNAEIIGERTIKLSNNVYSGVTTNGTARYIKGYSDTPMIKVIGFDV